MAGKQRKRKLKAKWTDDVTGQRRKFCPEHPRQRLREGQGCPLCSWGESTSVETRSKPDGRKLILDEW